MQLGGSRAESALRLGAEVRLVRRDAHGRVEVVVAPALLVHEAREVRDARLQGDGRRDLPKVALPPVVVDGLEEEAREVVRVGRRPRVLRDEEQVQWVRVRRQVHARDVVAADVKGVVAVDRRDEVASQVLDVVVVLQGGGDTRPRSDLGRGQPQRLCTCHQR